MTSTPIPGWAEVGASLGIVTLVIILAWRRRLNLTRELVIATVRAAVQLAAVGAVLLALFTRAGGPGAPAWIVFMVVLAGQVAGRRGKGLPHAVVTATVSVAAGTALTLGAVVGLGVISTEPRVLIPTGGMVVSGAMQATGAVLYRLVEEVQTGRSSIEARLSLGLTTQQAFLPHQRSAVRIPMLGVIDATKVVGLISLPGAMTGLIIAGVDPLIAIRYQIVVMYMLLGATALAAIVAVSLGQRAVFDDAFRITLPTRSQR